MTNRFRVSGTLANRLEESGISSETVLCRAGLSLGLFKQGKIFLTNDCHDPHRNCGTTEWYGCELDGKG